MSQTMVLFVSFCALASVLISFIVIYPWMRYRQLDNNRLMAVNVQTFYDRLAELEGDKIAGILSEDDYQVQAIALKRQLLDADSQAPKMKMVSVKGRLIVLIWIPVLTTIVYLLGEDRTPVFTLWVGQDSVGQVADDLMTAKIDTPPDWATKDSSALISAMQTNVHRHAYDANRWFRLSELFLTLEANPQALEALARAYRLDPNNDEIANTYAQIRFFTNEGRLDDIAQGVIADMLTKNPNHEGALMLMAMAETRSGNYDNARAWVLRLRSTIASKPGNRATALKSLDEMMAVIDAQAQDAKLGVAINVTVDSALLSQVQEDDVLFVAIVGEDKGPPYAVQKFPVSMLTDGKMSLTLSDSNAMLAGRTLQNARQANTNLIVTARISHTGDAISQSGDLLGLVPLAPDSSSATVHIAQIVP